MRFLWAIFLIAGLLPLFSADSEATTAGISPCANSTISVTVASSNVHLSTCGSVVLLWNTTSQEAFYAYGSASNTAATTSSYSLPGNSFVVLNLGVSGLYLAAITASSTTTLRITQGQAE